jgi:hypothetical protein
MSSSPRRALPPSVILQTQPASRLEPSASTMPEAQPPPSQPGSSSPLASQSHPVDPSPRSSSGSPTYFIPILPRSPSDIGDESGTQRLPAHHISVAPHRELPLDLATSEHTVLSSPLEYLASRGPRPSGPRRMLYRPSSTPLSVRASRQTLPRTPRRLFSRAKISWVIETPSVDETPSRNAVPSIEQQASSSSAH